jgi:hypothetical protein
MYPARAGGRTTYEQHAYDHEVRPVGDDDWLETLRDGDDIVIGRWRAPFTLTRRYLVTGQWDGGRDRTYAHNAVVLAMVGASRDAHDGTGGPTAASAPAADRRRFGFLRRTGDAPSPPGDGGRGAPPDDVAEARRAVDAVRERYLAASRRGGGEAPRSAGPRVRGSRATPAADGPRAVPERAGQCPAASTSLRWASTILSAT